MNTEKKKKSRSSERTEGFEEDCEAVKDAKRRKTKEDKPQLKGEGKEKDDGGGVAVSQKSDMEMKKKKKELDKERRRMKSSETDGMEPKKTVNHLPHVSEISQRAASKAVPGFHVDIFRDLSSVESSAREAAVQALVLELRKVQKAFEKSGGRHDDAYAHLEAEKDDGLKNCAPSLRYAIRRLIRGVSSPRECARQGFALGLTALIGTIKCISVDSLMKLIDDLLEVSSSMKGQEVRDCLLGRLFSYGALARSGRVVLHFNSDNKTLMVQKFVSSVISLANKKSYLREAAVSIILALADALPREALQFHILEAPGMAEWFEKATSIGNPDALYLSLQLRESLSSDNEILCKLLPLPFTPSDLFTSEHLSPLIPCLKETTFCQPRVHSVWHVLIDILFSDYALEKDAALSSDSVKAVKKSRKRSSVERNLIKQLDCFCSLIIDGSLLMSSHDRKHLAFDILLLLLPRLPASCVNVVLSYKLIQCLLDILSTKDSWLYKTAQHFLQELCKWAENDECCVAVIIALQNHSFGRFDCITRTHTVNDLVSKIKTNSGWMLFIQNLMSLFIDEKGMLEKSPAQAADESSDLGSIDNSDYPNSSGNADVLRSWIVGILPRVLKYLKVELDEKLHIHKEMLKFLTVQGLFTASLGTEVTSFELQEKLKWPKIPSSSYIRTICIQHLQILLTEAEKQESYLYSFRSEDLGAYFMHFLDTLCNIPSVSLFRSLSKEDEEAFKKLHSMEAQLSKMVELNDDSRQIYSMRLLLIQLLLEVLLKPGEFCETASELVICCKKAFPTLGNLDSAEEEDDGNTGAPVFMDVLIDTLLSLLPQVSAPILYAVEQVFRFFCSKITESGIVRMLRVIKTDLKRPRHQPESDEDEDEDDDEDFLEVEEAEDADLDQAEDVDKSDSDDVSDDESAEDPGRLKAMALDNYGPKGSDDSEDGMDDETMFRMDSYLAQIFKERKNVASGNGNAQSQLVTFKLRVLSLFEIFLNKNEANPLVLVVYPYMARAFINSYATEGSEQVGQRIAGVLQKKLFKAKYYPIGDEVQLPVLESQLQKSLRLLSRARQKPVASFAQSASFWLLKILLANFPGDNIIRVSDMFRSLLEDYFSNKKSRLKSGFIKEVFKRYPWTEKNLFCFLLEKATSTSSEYRKIEAVSLVEAILKDWVTSKEHSVGETSSVLEVLTENLPLLCRLLQELLTKPLSKGSRRSEVRRFLTMCLQAKAHFKLDSFEVVLTPDAHKTSLSYLGDKFLPLLKLEDTVAGK